VLSVEDIDLSDIAFWERPWAEREGAFKTLRRERPLARFAEPDWSEPEPGGPPAPVDLVLGPGYVAVTRYADVAEVSRHPEIYRSGRGAVSILDLPDEMVEYFAGMISTDNPRHARLRRIVSQAFSPRMIGRIEDDIERVTDAVVDRVAPTGACDFATDVAAPLPLEIICSMMGVSPDDQTDVLRCSNIILSNGDPEYVPAAVHPVTAILEAGFELTALMEAIGADRLAHPADDLTTVLVHGNVDGEALTHAELASFFILLLTAGNETTRNAISHGLWTLTEHPDQRAVWAEAVGAVTPSAVEEVVRWASPVIWMRRTLAEDAVLGGEELYAGDKVLLFYNSANRDEDAFDDPFRFDVMRTPNPHFGFGAAGPHFCLGAHLARREIAAMFAALFRRTPDIVATAPPDRLRSNFINGIKHLPCAFAPAG